MNKTFYTFSVYFLTGGQLLYQIPNNNVLTTKIGLLNSLREYDRVSSKVNYGCGNRLKMKIIFDSTRVTQIFDSIIKISVMFTLLGITTDIFLFSFLFVNLIAASTFKKCCRRMKLEDFFPVTFRMDMKDEREAYFKGKTTCYIDTDRNSR